MLWTFPAIAVGCEAEDVYHSHTRHFRSSRTLHVEKVDAKRASGKRDRRRRHHSCMGSAASSSDDQLISERRRHPHNRHNL